MFENIHFITYKIPEQKAVKDQIMSDEWLHLSGRAGEVIHPELSMPKQNDTSFSFPGQMEIFSKSPLSDFTRQYLFHMEAFTIFTCDKHFYTRRTNYPSFMILYTYEGKGMLEFRSKRYHLQAGDGFFIDCREPQFYRSDSDVWKHSVFHLNGPLLASLFADFIECGSPVFSQPVTGAYHTALESLLRIYNTASRHRDWQVSKCIDSLLTDLLVDSFVSEEQTDSGYDTIQYLVKYMENNFSSALSLDYLSDFSGLSKFYLSRQFKKHTGYAPNDYLIQLRIDHAKSLLLTTTLPANKIAHMSGMHNINNFNNLFKKKTGMTPGKFRSFHN